MRPIDSPAGWTFFNPVEVVFEPGALQRLPELVRFDRVALVTTAGFRRRGLVGVLERILGERVVAIVDDVNPNPDVRDVDAQADGLRPAAPDAILAIGGGSTIDTAKALARLLAQGPDTRLVDQFRSDRKTKDRALPLIAVPTTSGTGAEVTPFGTIWDFELGRKYSITGKSLFPVLAVLDPELTIDLPPEPTLVSGMDCISHAFESAWNRAATPVTLGLIAESLRLSLNALPVVMEQPGDREGRAQMMQASLLAGLAISQTRTALAHSISYPLTTAFGLPHGLACSFTLPALLEFNAEADDGRLARLASYLGHPHAKALSLALADLFEKLEIGRYLFQYVPNPEAVDALLGQMITPERAGNNLRPATGTIVETLVRRSLASLHG